MPMDQAKWYYILWNDIDPPRKLYNNLFNYYFKHLTLLYLLYSDHGFRRMFIMRKGNSFGCKIFCGQKKLNKLIEEAHLLGLEDELLIFKKGEMNG